MLFDFIPIVIFFVVYKFLGIYYATAIAMVICLIQNTIYYIRHKKFEPLQLITFIVIFLLGGATLLSHNPLFIKWKPSVVYWIFSLLFLGSHFMKKKPLFQIAMENKISLTDIIWKKLNYSWGLFFLLMGSVNIFVAYRYSTNTWVNFKLFGILGLTVLFCILQAIFLAKHVANETTKLS